MNKTAILAFILTFVLVVIAANDSKANPPKNNTNGSTRTKFYDFNEMLIDGEYKKPQILYTDTRQKVKFERLLKLKKSFLPKLMSTAKDPVLR